LNIVVAHLIFPLFAQIVIFCNDALNPFIVPFISSLKTLAALDSGILYSLGWKLGEYLAGDELQLSKSVWEVQVYPAVVQADEDVYPIRALVPIYAPSLQTPEEL